MSVIGIAGSGALLVTAFGLNDSIFGIIEKQFGDIWQMDVQAYVYEAMPLADMQELLGKTRQTTILIRLCSASIPKWNAKRRQKPKRRASVGR